MRRSTDVLSTTCKKLVTDLAIECKSSMSSNESIQVTNNSTNSGFLYNLFIELTNSHSLIPLNIGRVLSVPGYNLIDLENEYLSVGGQGSSVNATQ